MKQDLISAKKIVQNYNLTYQTVNHYTNFGLINVVSKKGNVRLYDEDEINDRLTRIALLINAELPLRVIRKTLNDELTIKVLNKDTVGT